MKLSDYHVINEGRVARPVQDRRLTIGVGARIRHIASGEVARIVVDITGADCCYCLLWEDAALVAARVRLVCLQLAGLRELLCQAVGNTKHVVMGGDVLDLWEIVAEDQG